MKQKIYLIIVFTLLAYSVKAQVGIEDSLIVNAKKLDVQNIKQLSQVFYSLKFNCDSLNTGTIVELRYCANIELQKQDSLLHSVLATFIKESETSNDTTRLKEILLAQELWERYRYAHCSNCVIDGGRYDMIMFLRCATELTIKRIKDIDQMCGY